MLPSPVLEMSSISWITAELVIVDNISNPGLDECYRVTCNNAFAGAHDEIQSEL